MRPDLDTPYHAPLPAFPPWWPGARVERGVSTPTGWGRGRVGAQDVGVGGYQASRECAMQKSERPGVSDPASRGPADLFWGRHPGNLYPSAAATARGNE